VLNRYSKCLQSLLSGQGVKCVRLKHSVLQKVADRLLAIDATSAWKSGGDRALAAWNEAPMIGILIICFHEILSQAADMLAIFLTLH
jgi:hypothetical protein